MACSAGYETKKRMEKNNQRGGVAMVVECDETSPRVAFNLHSTGRNVGRNGTVSLAGLKPTWFFARFLASWSTFWIRN